MGKHIHRLSEKDFDARTAVCANCGPVDIAVYGNTYRCMVAHLGTRNRMKSDREGTQSRRFRDLKKDYCEDCGFQAIHKCQLDLHHIDGDRTNHDESNIKTLCSNCHRLLSYHPELYPAPSALVAEGA